MPGAKRRVPLVSVHSMNDWLPIYLTLGALVAIIDSEKVARECSILSTFEQFLLFTRVALAWPTYVVEDFKRWKDGDEG